MPEVPGAVGLVVLIGLALIALAGRVQSLLLARRIDRMVHAGLRDPGSGMFAPEAGRVRLQAEVSRVRRTDGAGLELRRGRVDGRSDEARDAQLRDVAGALPAGSVAVRVGDETWAAAIPSAGASEAPVSPVGPAAAPGAQVALVARGSDDAAVAAALAATLDPGQGD